MLRRDPPFSNILLLIDMASKYGSGNSSSSKQKEEETSSLVAVGAAAVGVAAVAWWGLSSLFGSSDSSDEKMMKAPGQNYSIRRKDFESNPAEYFRNNRSKQSK